MRIAVFTSNQPRHLALIEALAAVADTVLAVQECTTVFPGEVEDSYRASPVMRTYFSRVIAAERRIFGQVRFLPANVRQLALKAGDLPRLETEVLAEALAADLFVVFGASWIRPPLVDLLIERRAVNIHMGVSPYYRGSSCNFWALYDGNADLVGATIHRLSKGLDSGEMLFHALPRRRAVDPFDLGMEAVRAAHLGLAEEIRRGRLLRLESVRQDRAREIRYTRNSEFTDEVAGRYLDRGLTAVDVERMFAHAPARDFVAPFYA